jgi:hypothetical protein
MKLTLKVETTENTYEVTTNLYVIVMWERKYKRKASEMATGIGVEDLAFMAYEASKLNKIVVPAEFDTFVKNLVTIDVLNTEAPNPT